MSPSLRLVIVGGVAGGASAAARARRLSEDASIVLFERGPHVSFANCGLPYHLGGVIEDRSKLLLQTPESLYARFEIDVRVNTEVVAIEPEARIVVARNLKTGKEIHKVLRVMVHTDLKDLNQDVNGKALVTIQALAEWNADDADFEKGAIEAIRGIKKKE